MQSIRAKSTWANHIAPQLNRFSSLLIRHPWRVLLVLFAMSVPLRLVSVFAAGDLPSIMPDEMRYMHIARSIFSDGRVFVRGQPVGYTHLLYPLLLAPLFALPDSVNIFRVVQTVNVLALHAMIFPAYALALRLNGGKKGAALGVAALTLIIPDSVLSKMVMTESFGFPLFFITFLLAYDLLTKPQTWRAIMTGVLCFLLYALKPVYVTFGIALALVWGVSSLLKKDKRSLILLAQFVATMAVLYILYRLALRFILQMDPAQQMLYDAQTAPFSLDHLLRTLVGMQAYVYYHLIAFGLLPLALVLSAWRSYEGPQRIFTLAFLCSLLLSLLVTVYIINVDEWIRYNWNPLRVHTRYAAMYLPVLLMLMTNNKTQNTKVRSLGLVCGLWIVLGLVFYNTQELANGFFPVDSPLLAMLLWKSGEYDGLTMWLPMYIPWLLGLFLLVMKKVPTIRWQRVFWIVTVIALSLNTVAAYQRNQTGHAQEFSVQAKKAVETTNGSAWFINVDGRERWSAATAIDVHSHYEMPVISLSDLLANTNGDGITASVLPSDVDNFLFTRGVNAFAPRNYLIFDAEILSQVVLQRQDEIIRTDGDLYAIVPFAENEPWIHSLLYGLTSGWVSADSRFLLYDPALRENGEITLQLYACAGEAEGGEGILRLTSSDGQYIDFSLGREMTWTEATFPIPASSEPFTLSLTSEKGEIYVETYLVE